MSHREIAEVLAIPKGSLTPLLRTLVAREFIEYDHITKGYRLGTMFAQLARRAGEQESLLGFVHPILVEISQVTAESCLLTELRGDEGETVDSVIGPHRLVSHMRVGDRGPLYALSGGKAILAHLPEKMRTEYLDRVEFEEITANTIRNRAELVRQLQEVRATGISYSVEEFTIGIAGIGAPIISNDGFPVGAISVVMPVMRFNDDLRGRAIAALRAARNKIDRQLARVSPSAS